MDERHRIALLKSYAQIRCGLEASQKLFATIDAECFGDDGQAKRALLLERTVQQLKRLSDCEALLERS